MKFKGIYISFFVFGVYSSLVLFYLEQNNSTQILHYISFGVINFSVYSITLFLSTSGINNIEFDGSKFQLLVRIICISFLLSVLLIFGYSSLFGISEPSIDSFTSVFIELTIVGILPVILGMYFYEKRLMKIKYESINFQSIDEEKTSEIIVNSDGQKKSLNLNLENLLLIEGADNYCNIYFKEGDIVKKELFRSTLKNLHNQLDEIDYIYRCHRSYIINSKNIDKVSGKSQAYKIEFKGVKIKVPVSRSFDISVLQS